MGHCIQVFVGRKEVLDAIYSKYGQSKVIPLRQGFFLLPLIDELYDSIDEVADKHDYLSSDGFEFLSPKITKLLLDFSDAKGLVYLETDYFGGIGEQGAIAAKEGKIVYGPSKEKRSINKALRKIGVIRILSDEFDTIGLGRFRDNEDWILQPSYGKPIPASQRLPILFRFLLFLKEPFGLKIDGDDIIYRKFYITKKVNLSDLMEVYIKTTDKGPMACDVFFVLKTSKRKIVIPQDLQGCDQLLNKLQELEDFDHQAVIEAMSCFGNNKFNCWKK